MVQGKAGTKKEEAQGYRRRQHTHKACCIQAEFNKEAGVTQGKTGRREEVRRCLVGGVEERQAGVILLRQTLVCVCAGVVACHRQV